MENLAIDRPTFFFAPSGLFRASLWLDSGTGGFACMRLRRDSYSSDQVGLTSEILHTVLQMCCCLDSSLSCPPLSPLLGVTGDEVLRCKAMRCAAMRDDANARWLQLRIWVYEAIPWIVSIRRRRQANSGGDGVVLAVVVVVVSCRIVPCWATKNPKNKSSNGLRPLVPERRSEVPQGGGDGREGKVRAKGKREPRREVGCGYGSTAREDPPKDWASPVTVSISNITTPITSHVHIIAHGSHC